ncbi:MAG: cobalamin-binding protein [SAR324 cluster bacterium]|nr:cobalamin-binding protein [SAR324 cluster bacterium]
MARPNFAFKTSTHTVCATTTPGVYLAEPGGHQLEFSLQEQRVPEALCSTEMERAAMAWVMARGGRELFLNGVRRPVSPDQLGRPPQSPVRRLISIAPSNAEIVGALAATDLLVGVESSSDFPPEVQALPRLGPDLHVDMDALAALEPDLVLASLTVPGMERNVTALEQLGIPYLVCAPRNLEEIRREIGRVGRAIGREAAAQQCIKRMDQAIAEFGTRRRSRPVRVYLEWWPKPMFSPGSTCWSNELIELAGGKNVFQHLPTQSGEVEPADVVAADPEVIFLSWCGVPQSKLNPERVYARKGLEQVSAIRNRRVFPIDENLLGRPGPRVVEGIAAMAEKLAEV